VRKIVIKVTHNPTNFTCKCTGYRCSTWGSIPRRLREF